jgi:hypothetical protein
MSGLCICFSNVHCISKFEHECSHLVFEIQHFSLIHQNHTTLFYERDGFLQNNLRTNSLNGNFSLI